MTLNEIELLRGKEQQFWSRADLSETLNCDQGAGVNTHVLDPGSECVIVIVIVIVIVSLSGQPWASCRLQEQCLQGVAFLVRLPSCRRAPQLERTSARHQVSQWLVATRRKSRAQAHARRRGCTRTCLTSTVETVCTPASDCPGQPVVAQVVKAFGSTCPLSPHHQESQPKGTGHGSRRSSCRGSVSSGSWVGSGRVSSFLSPFMHSSRWTWRSAANELLCVSIALLGNVLSKFSLDLFL